MNADTEFLQSGDSGADVDRVAAEAVEFRDNENITGFELVDEPDEAVALRDGDAAGDGLGDDATRFDGMEGRRRWNRWFK